MLLGGADKEVFMWKFYHSYDGRRDRKYAQHSGREREKNANWTIKSEESHYHSRTWENQDPFEGKSII